jgi:putative redox protein
MEAKVIWKGNLSLEGTADSGFMVPLGAKAEVGGSDDGFQPMELIALGLAGCTAMDVISIMQKKRQVVTKFEVQVHAERAEEHPKVITEAVIEYLISGSSVDELALLRSIQLSAERYCPAQAMLAQVFPIELRYSIFEDEPGGERRLIKSGVYLQRETEAS